MVICSVEINLIISENVNPYPLQVIQPNSGHFHDAVTLLCTFGKESQATIAV
jgi:hypothetical protein